MTQNLCSKQETLLKPQEGDIKRFSKGEQTISGTNGRVNGRLTSDQAETIENRLMQITDQPLYTRS